MISLFESATEFHRLLGDYGLPTDLNAQYSLRIGVCHGVFGDAKTRWKLIAKANIQSALGAAGEYGDIVNDWRKRLLAHPDGAGKNK